MTVREATDDYIRQHGVHRAVGYFAGCVGTWRTVAELGQHGHGFDVQFARDSLALYQTELEYVRGVAVAVDRAVEQAVRPAWELELSKARAKCGRQRRAYAELERAYRRLCSAVSTHGGQYAGTIWDRVRVLAGDVPIPTFQVDALPGEVPQSKPHRFIEDPDGGPDYEICPNPDDGPCRDCDRE